MYGYIHSSGIGPPPGRRLVVTDQEHVILWRSGKLRGVLEPGRYWLSKSRDRIWSASAAPQLMVVAGQEILTADGVGVRATVSLTYRITQPLVTMRAGDWTGQLYVEAQLALRRHVTAASIEELVGARASLDEALRADITPVAAGLGVEVLGLALRDLVVPGEQRKLLAEVVAARLAGQAALERARGETAALRNLANAASLLKDNPELYRLRLLQEIAGSTGNTFVVDTEPR